MAMLWRHPEHIDLDQISVIHYCANVRLNSLFRLYIYALM